MTLALSLAAPLALTACAQQGDFGRPAKSAWNGLIETTGTIAARERNEPASWFPLTDDEHTLRDRSWRFLMPAQPRGLFDAALDNLTRSRVLPADRRTETIASYHAGLLSEAFRSPVSRYRRLSEDTTADARLIPPFAALAARVLDTDGLRLRGLPFARSLEDYELRQAAMRVAENRCLIAWVRLEAGLRAARYRYALEHLLAEVPGREAVPSERALAFLDDRRGLLDALLPLDAAERCGLVAPAPAALAEPLVAKY